MRFAQPWWLAGTAVAALVALLLVLGGMLLLRAVRRFGDEERVQALVTARAAGRRALKGVLSVIAVAFAFVALAQPQYGRGTRLIPATNLDVVIVLDYSKSMYARDVTPYRIARAKSEVGRLIADLPGARFGAVAFAGEPLSFPLTSDGAAIAQFFRQLSPTDLPVGGTAIARALDAARQLFGRDPLSAKHKKVIVLVTDGEDLEGDPVAVAREAAENQVTVIVVQVGGRTPEPLPEVDEAGEVVGWRQDSDGKPLTTALSAEGEQQLAEVARVTGGSVVRSVGEQTGIPEVAASLRKMMTEQLSERVETVYADVFAYPAGLAVLLLLIEVFIPEARRSVRPQGGDRKRDRRRRSTRPIPAGSPAILLVFLLGAGGCNDGFKDPFIRHSPEVDRAIEVLEKGDAAGAAAGILERYLSTGSCKNGQIETPDSVRQRTGASFDLGLALFELGERYGERFDAEPKPEAPADPQRDAKRSAEVDCALRIVQIVANDSKTPVDLRAHAHYLAGNLEFLRQDYRAAVDAYDRALRLVPGLEGDKGDPVGRNAAYNRAIALRRLEEDKPDAGPPPPPDGGDNQNDGGQRDGDGGQDESKDDEKRPDGGPPEPNPSSQDGGSGQDEPKPKPDSKQDPSAQNKPQQTPGGQPSAAPPQPSLSQDERLLDMLEQAPTVQQEAAKKSATRRRGIVMEDK